MTDAPRYCRRPAYEMFAAQLKTLEETDSLLRAAVAVSMHEIAGSPLENVEKLLNGLASEVQGRVKTGARQAFIAQLHQVLFDEYRLRGNEENYYSAENSYLSRVLAERQGIPVTLSLIYKCVAQRVGLNVRGINSPVHFLASIETDQGWMIVDPFYGGRVLTEDEIFEQLERMAGAPVTRSKAMLTTATHVQWLARIIRNLEQVFQNEGRQNDQLAMQELLALVIDMD